MSVRPALRAPHSATPARRRAMRRPLALAQALAVLAVLGIAAVHQTAAADMSTALRAAFARGELAGLHSVVVLREGAVFGEAHFPGQDERWGGPLGRRQHGPHTLHDLRSVTKSVVGLLYGIALAAAQVPALDTPVLSRFPEHADLAKDDPRRGRITVAHALAMTMGMEWNEDRPYTDPANSEIGMERATDRYRFVLSRQMVAEPGTQWRYNGGATALVGRIIELGVGERLDRYAERVLFAPLGIERFEWVAGADGQPSAASGLRLTAHGLARIGQLVVDDGRVGDRVVVPRSWLDTVSTPRATPGPLRYGYTWWLAEQGDPPHWMAGFGNGGQRLSVSRTRRLVVTVFAGNYNRADAWRLPVKVITDFLVPALAAR